MQAALARVSYSLHAPAAAAATAARVLSTSSGKRKAHPTAPAPRNRVEWGKVSPARVAWEADRQPEGGRFSASLVDAADKECEPIAILDPVGATELGRAAFNERRRMNESRAPPRPSEAEAAMEADLAASRQKDIDDDDDDDTDRMWGSLVSQFKSISVAATQARTIFSREQLSTDPLLCTKRVGGDARMEAIRKTLNSLGYSRSQYQKVGTQTCGRGR